MTKSNITILAIVLLVVAVLATKNHYETESSVLYESKLIDLQKSIDAKDSLILNLLDYKIKLNDKVSVLSAKNDSLQIVKNKVKVLYEKVYINIDHANNIQLDSIIRANW